MRRTGWAAAGLAVAMAWPAAADWQPVERIAHYGISGTTGIELYRSIGARGPQVSMGRAIALTDFELLWSRDYRPQGDGSCLLATARPSLTITYRLPRPEARLDAENERLWRRFADGIEAHERVHGQQLVEMARAIEYATAGLSVADDPGCRKIRDQVLARVREITAERNAASEAFDRDEFRNGGNMHRLILGLVNGW